MRQRSRLPKSRAIASASAPLARRAAAEAVEIDLVQDHRIRGDQLLALEAVDDEVRRLGKIEIGELGADRIEPLHRADVVVLVMADEDLLGNALDRLRIE